MRESNPPGQCCKLVPKTDRPIRRRKVNRVGFEPTSVGLQPTAKTTSATGPCIASSIARFHRHWRQFACHGSTRLITPGVLPATVSPPCRAPQHSKRRRGRCCRIRTDDLHAKTAWAPSSFELSSDLVSVTGIEPATSCTPSKRSTTEPHADDSQRGGSRTHDFLFPKQASHRRTSL